MKALNALLSLDDRIKDGQVFSTVIQDDLMYLLNVSTEYPEY